MAKEYFDEWFPAAIKRFEGAKFYLEKGYLNDAAFDLHQATERLYNCVLLVCTSYVPHVHNLAFLRTQAERLDPRLIHAWPREKRGHQRYFELLKDAYVKARYPKLCRVRHNFDYAERHTMPSGRKISRFTNGLRVIGSA
jgi:HEPN domain-containing protein